MPRAGRDTANDYRRSRSYTVASDHWHFAGFTFGFGDGVPVAETRSRDLQPDLQPQRRRAVTIVIKC